MSWRRWLALLALGAAPAAAEAAILRAVGLRTAIALAPQITAPSPYGNFHDLRWIFVYHKSWPGLVAELVVAVLLRSALTCALVWLAWPAERARPSPRALARRAAGFHAAAALIMSPWAAVAMAASETSLSWFLFGEVMPVLVLGLVLQRGAVTGDWWRGLPNRELVAWGLTGFAAVTITGMVVAFTPGWWVAPVAGAGGAVNAALWRRVVVAAVNRPIRLRRVPGAVLVSVALVAALAPAGSVAGWAVAAASTPGPPITGAGVAAVYGPVIYIAGYDSVYHGPSRRPGLPLEHFSYRGLDARGRPLPYGAADTQEPLAISAGILSRQVEQAHRASGRMVALVAQSEGTLVARAYLESHPHPPVDAVAFLSPLVRPGRVYFPPRDAASGWGIASGWVLRGMLAVVNWAGGTQIFADAPFVRSVLDSAPVYRNRMLCPVPGVRMVAFIPLVSAAVVPPGRYASIPVVGVPGWHASLLGRGDVQRDLLAFLAGRTPDSAPGLLYPVVQRAAAAWQAPALALSVNPVWRAAKRPDASFGDDGCAAR